MVKDHRPFVFLRTSVTGEFRPKIYEEVVDEIGVLLSLLRPPLISFCLTGSSNNLIYDAYLTSIRYLAYVSDPDQEQGKERPPSFISHDNSLVHNTRDANSFFLWLHWLSL
jgi:hypothetical protein